MSKELEALEKIKKVKVDKETPMSATYLIHDKRYTEDVAVIEKGLEALEIIKDFISLEPHCIYGKAKRNLTQEEYDLLKEVLK